MITLIGAGNVAHWIVQQLRGSKEFPIGQIYSRKLEHAAMLAEKVGAQAIDDLGKLDPTSEIYVFSVKDDAYPAVLSSIPFELPVAIHTAGAVSQDIFHGKARHYGVLYPLQTFSKAADLQTIRVPLCIEDNALGAQRDKVMRLASELSGIQYAITEEQRAVLHLAAVFACNFSNAMARAAETILNKEHLDFKMLHPIMQQTLSKLDTMSPKEAQTGPAVRRDNHTMEKHLQMLPSDELKTIYRQISQYIMSEN